MIDYKIYNLLEKFALLVSLRNVVYNDMRGDNIDILSDYRFTTWAIISTPEGSNKVNFESMRKKNLTCK